MPAMTPAQKQSVYLKILSNLFLILGFVFITIGFGPLVYDNARYYVHEYLGQYYVLLGFPQGSVDREGSSGVGALGTNETSSNSGPRSIFSLLIRAKELDLEPANLDFSLAIEKIGLAAPVVSNVPVSDNKAYMEALREGIAHASVSSYPSELPGNTYLFAHSSFDFRLLGEYSRAFNLLDKLEVGDRIHVFYEGRDYVYSVVNSEILPGWDTHPLDRKVVSPVLTLQSCYPPGTTLNRIVITAELIR